MIIFFVIFSIVLIVAGIAGLFVPYLPDAPLVFSGILIFSFATNFDYLHPITLIVLGVLTTIIVVADIIASQIGVKKLGGSTLAIVFSCLGGFIGLLTWNIPGLIVGIFFGALFGEIIKTKDIKKSAKVSLGSLIGFIGGILFKAMMLVLMIGIFIGSFLV